MQVVGTSLDEHDRDSFLEFARRRSREFARRRRRRRRLAEFAKLLHWAPGERGPAGAARAPSRRPRPTASASSSGCTTSRVPPKAALAVVHQLKEAGLVERSRIIMEKPFGTDLASAQKLNAELHEVFDEEQIFRIDHFLGKEAAQNILAFRFANGLFEPIWHRNHIDHVQIDVPETLGLAQRADFYEGTGAYRDMVVTHLFQVLAFTAMEPPTALEPARDQRGEEQGLPLDAADRAARRRPRPVRRLPRHRRASRHDSETETFVALKCFVDNWRWAGVPFYLRTGKRLAEGARIISIAFREPPRSMFPPGSGVGDNGPDHLTFDLADQAKMSLSFYGKRPGPGHEARQAVDAVRDARDRLGRRGPRGLRAADLRRRARRPHPVHHRPRASSGCGRSPQPLLDNPPDRAPLRAGLVGPQPDPPADRAVRLAAAVRAPVAQPQRGRGLGRAQELAIRAASLVACALS